jgi:hypothetical protein
MAERSRGRAAVKFGFWTASSIAGFLLIAHLHTSGKFAAWYYCTAAEDGYAVNADTFMKATPDNPVLLEIGSYEKLDGPQAVAVKKGDRLPTSANGIITSSVLKEGKRATVEGSQVKVTVPWKIEYAKGFKFMNTFKHKGVKTYPWAAVYNVLLIFGLGIALGFMAEGFTDVIGIKVEKIRHFEGH